MKFALSSMLIAVVFVAAARCQEKPPPQVDGKSAAQWVEELGGAAPDVAINALVRLGPAAALPELAACVEARPEAQAFQAARALRSLEPKDGPERLAFGAAAKRIGQRLADPDLKPGSAKCALLALAALGPNSDAGAENVAEFLKTNKSSQGRLAAALALRETGPKAARAIVKALDEVPVAGAFCVLAGSVGYDKSAAPLAKPLTNLIAKEETGRGYLLCRAGRVVLEKIAGTKKADEAFALRREMRSGAALPGSGVNFGVMVPTAKETFRIWLEQEIPAVRSIDFAVIGLAPENVERFYGTYLSLGDLVSHYGVHLVRELPALAERWRRDEFKSLAEWDKAAEPLRQTIELLNALTSGG